MTQATLLVRDGTPDDASAMARIYAPEVRLGTASYELDPPDTAEMARRLADVTSHGYPWLVAEWQGDVVGYAYASAFRMRPAYRYTVENSVYVADWARQRGVARALMEALIDRCTARGDRRMVAVIGDRRNRASVALHNRLGFVEVGIIPGAGTKFGGWIDLLILHRPLGPGSTEPPGGG